jgi:hypothetical protein
VAAVFVTDGAICEVCHWDGFRWHGIPNLIKVSSWVQKLFEGVVNIYMGANRKMISCITENIITHLLLFLK